MVQYNVPPRSAYLHQKQRRAGRKWQNKLFLWETRLGQSENIAIGISEGSWGICCVADLHMIDDFQVG
jgi:hypothetical protein